MENKELFDLADELKAKKLEKEELDAKVKALNAEIETLDAKLCEEMTNQELKQHINRMRLEQQYKELKQSDVRRGREYVMSYVRDYATLAGAVATTAAIAKTAYTLKTGNKI